MVTNSSVLAWEIPRTEEPARQQSMGCQESDLTDCRKRCFQLLQDEISYPRISRCHLTTPGPTFMNKEIHCYCQFTLGHQALLVLQIQERH